MSNDVYLGNPLLKKANTAIEFTQEQIEEYIKCKNDPIYFARNYVKIVTLDHGLQPFKTYDFQEKLIERFHHNRFNICKMPRQTGKSTTCVSYLLHYAIFNDSVNIGILANKATTARELLARLATAYENLPKWMQQGILVWNKGNIELENGSKILAASTSASAVRGMSFNILFLDEFAFVPNHVADAFFASVYPTITSGKSTKVIVVSTPHGMNHFYRMWHDAEKGKNEYIPTDVHWSEVPGRDEVWKEQTIKNTSEQQFKIEFECVGGDTLIEIEKNGVVSEVKIEDLYNRLVGQMYKVNNDIKVKTPTGFQSFSGIQKVFKPFYHWIIFDDGSEIKCSDNHSFGSDKVKASSLKPDDIIQGKKVVYNEIVEKGIYLYDLLDVGEENLYITNKIISHNCEFLGSVDTLIAPSKLKSLIYDNPIKQSAGLDIHEEPKPDHDYIVTVDVARGVGEDYSAFIVADITTFPHRVVGKYRNNTIKPMLFPNIIWEVAKSYNNAFILCEVNDIGDQIASILQYDLEYQNLLMCAMRGRAGQVVGQGFSGTKTQLGVKMSKTVKKIGALNLKTMIEEDKLIFNDYEIISELTTFISKGNSFEAEEGCNDDLAMCLVIYAWLVAQDYFKELTEQDVRKRLYEEQKNQIEQDMAPFGFLNDGIDDDTFVDSQGDRWTKANPYDEYGNTAGGWTLWNY